MKKIIPLSTVVSALILFSGCTSLSNVKLEKEFNKMTTKEYDVNKLSESKLKGNVKVNVLERKFVKIEESKSLSNVLKELEKIENKIYFYKGDDINIPESSYEIGSFEDLQNYMVKTLNMIPYNEEDNLNTKINSYLKNKNILKTNKEKLNNISSKKKNLENLIKSKEMEVQKLEKEKESYIKKYKLKISEKTMLEKESLSLRNKIKSLENKSSKKEIEKLNKELSKIENYISNNQIHTNNEIGNINEKISNSKNSIKDIELKISLKNKEIKEITEKRNKDINVIKVKSLNGVLYPELEKIKLNLEGKYSLEDIKKEISLNTKLNIILSDNILLTNKDIYLNNNQNIIEVLNLISEMFDVYYTINYESNSLKFEKYKSNLINVYIPDSSQLSLEENAELEVEDGSAEGETMSGSSSLEIEENPIVTNLKTMITEITNLDEKSKFNIDSNSGVLNLYCTKSQLSKITDVVKVYEKIYSKEVRVEFGIIEVLLEKSNNYGIGTDLSIAHVSALTTPEQTLKKTITNSIGKFSFKNTSGNHQMTSVFNLRTNHEIARVVNIRKNLLRLKNNILSTQNFQTVTNYISKITTETVNTDSGVTTNINPEVSSITEGINLSMKAKIYNDKIHLQVRPSNLKINSLKEKTIGTETINLPSYSTQNLNSNVEMKVDDKIIIGSIIVHDDAKNYAGMVPVENFVLGGENDDSYVRKEIIFTLKLKNIKK